MCQSFYSGVESMKYSWLCVSSVEPCSFLPVPFLALIVSHTDVLKSKVNLCRYSVISFPLKFFYLVPQFQAFQGNFWVLFCYVPSDPWFGNALHIVFWGSCRGLCHQFSFCQRSLSCTACCLSETCCFIYFMFQLFKVGGLNSFLFLQSELGYQPINIFLAY